MNKIKYLFLSVVAAILALGTASCSDDDPQSVLVPTQTYKAVVISATGGNISPEYAAQLKKKAIVMAHMTDEQAYAYWKQTYEGYVNQYADGFKIADEIEDSKGNVIDYVPFEGVLTLQLAFENEAGEQLEVATYEMTNSSCKLLSVDKTLSYKAIVASLGGDSNLSEANRQAILDRYQYCSAITSEEAEANFDAYVASLAKEYASGIKYADRVQDPETSIWKNIPFEGTLIVNLELKDAAGNVVKTAALSITSKDCTIL